MESMLSKLGGVSHAALRIVSGFMFACHGAQKLFGAFGGVPGMDIPTFGLVWFAGVIEIVGGSLIALGVRTQIAAFICSGEMAVAYFVAHFSRAAPIPIQNKGEIAVLYCFVFLYLATNGGGPFGLERRGK
jgi:putative oxidoreductase